MYPDSNLFLPALIGSAIIVMIAGAILVSTFLFNEPEDFHDINTPIPPEDPFGEDGEDSDTRHPTHFK